MPHTYASIALCFVHGDHSGPEHAEMEMVRVCQVLMRLERFGTQTQLQLRLRFGGL